MMMMKVVLFGVTEAMLRGCSKGVCGDGEERERGDVTDVTKCKRVRCTGWSYCGWCQKVYFEKEKHTICQMAFCPHTHGTSTAQEPC